MRNYVTMTSTANLNAQVRFVDRKCTHGAADTECWLSNIEIYKNWSAIQTRGVRRQDVRESRLSSVNWTNDNDLQWSLTLAT